MFENNYGEQAF